MSLISRLRSLFHRPIQKVQAPQNKPVKPEKPADMPVFTNDINNTAVEGSLLDSSSDQMFVGLKKQSASMPVTSSDNPTEKTNTEAEPHKGSKTRTTEVIDGGTAGTITVTGTPGAVKGAKNLSEEWGAQSSGSGHVAGAVIGGTIGGVKDSFNDIGQGVKNAADAVGNKVKSFLHIK